MLFKVYRSHIVGWGTPVFIIAKNRPEAVEEVRKIKDAAISGLRPATDKEAYGFLSKLMTEIVQEAKSYFKKKAYMDTPEQWEKFFYAHFVELLGEPNGE